MIYVLASYSITVGTLALYGVFMQHRVRIYALDRSVPSSPSASGRPFGFNLGAALLSPFWMWQHGMRAAGAALFVSWLALVPLYEREMWIPLLFVAMIPLAAGAALGFVGDRIAINHRLTDGSADRSGETVAEFATSQLPWAIAGVGLFTIVLPWLWYFLYAA